MSQPFQSSQTLSPGFFDPLNDTSLEVTIPQPKNVDDTATTTGENAASENAVVKLVGRMSALFIATRGCACKKKIEKVYSY